MQLCGSRQWSDISEPDSPRDLDSRQSPCLVAPPGSALIVVRCGRSPEADASARPERLVFSLTEVAWMTGFSERGIERDCRAGKVRHVHRGQTRGMTREQIEELVAVYTTHPQSPHSSRQDDRSSVEAAAERTRRRLRGRR